MKQSPNRTIMQFEIWAFGSNGSGQLGLGHDEDVSSPTRCIFPNSQISVSSRPCAFAAGGNHSLIICEDGALYAAGANDDGRCGSAQFSSSSTLSKVHFYDEDDHLVDRFILCAATWEASTLVSTNGKVYTCGTGNKGELAQGANIVASLTPKLIQGFPPTGISIVQLASSMAHTVAVLSNGDVYGWGSGRKGQLGEPSAITSEPRKIDVPFRVTKVACGREFTYLAGPADRGEHLNLGSNKWDVQSSAPQSIRNWKSIGTNWGSIHVLLADGKMISWGRNNHGQLSPVHVPRFSEMAAGSEHVVAKTTDGHIMAWGWGEHGNCGVTTKDNGDVENHINNIDVPQNFGVFGAGCATSWLVRSRKA